jgi:NADH dehydrogenase
LLLARCRGQAERPFRYRDFGSLATIGRKLAVAELGGVRLSGFAAWVLWSVAHVYFLIGFRSRMVVALTWLWNYLTFERGTRLITGHVEADSKSRPESAPKSTHLEFRADVPLRAPAR